MEVTAYELNLRHLRAFVEVCQCGSISRASETVHLSQPAITQAIAGLEDQLRVKMFKRMPHGMVPTPLGQVFQVRITRALARLNATTARGGRTSQRDSLQIETRVSTAQLRTLFAIGERASYSAAARLLGAAQPTVYRAARDLEDRLNVELFEKTATGVRLTRYAEQLARNARLMFAELDQGVQELKATTGHEAARIRLGALPLARATILSDAINQVFESGMPLQVNVDDGPFTDLFQAMRAGGLDILVGALRKPQPANDIVQETLFVDQLAVFCGPGHPLLYRQNLHSEDLADFPWVLPRSDTPTRTYFDSAFSKLSGQISHSLVETSSVVLMRALLQSHNRLTLISRAQVATETHQGLLFELPIDLQDSQRPIGILRRSDWYPTAAQDAFLDALRRASANL